MFLLQYSDSLSSIESIKGRPDRTGPFLIYFHIVHRDFFIRRKNLASFNSNLINLYFCSLLNALINTCCAANLPWKKRYVRNLHEFGYRPVEFCELLFLLPITVRPQYVKNKTHS